MQFLEKVEINRPRYYLIKSLASLSLIKTTCFPFSANYFKMNSEKPNINTTQQSQLEQDISSPKSFVGNEKFESRVDLRVLQTLYLKPPTQWAEQYNSPLTLTVF